MDTAVLLQQAAALDAQANTLASVPQTAGQAPALRAQADAIRAEIGRRRLKLALGVAGAVLFGYVAWRFAKTPRAGNPKRRRRRLVKV